MSRSAFRPEGLPRAGSRSALPRALGRVPRSANPACLGSALAAVLLLLAVPLAAQSEPWDRQVARGLDRTTEVLTGRGYTPTGPRHRGMLNAEDSDRVEVPVTNGAEYVLVGTCDDDCTGLKLVIANPTGYEIDAARGPGNAPIIRVTPPVLPGQYRVTVTMAGCRVSPCRYGVQVYMRKAGGAERVDKAN
jgi:hypothetical protein